MTVYFFQYGKKKNSTATPQLEAGTAYTNILLKEPCNITRPVLIISADSLPTPTIAPTIYNYAMISKFQRYYFVNDWTYIGGRWECELVCDVLASFKASIGGCTAYIERAESAYDGDIIDGLFPATTNFSIAKTALTYSWLNVNPSAGCYVLGIINYQTSNHVGAVSYYALTTAQLNSILGFLFSNNIFASSNITEIGEGLFKSLFNPFQYIVSCIWFPFSSTAFGSTATDVKVGYWSTGVNGVMVSSFAQTTYVNATIPNHPQASSRGAYLNYAPYTRHTIYLPPFGAIPLDTNFRRIGNYLYSAVVVDHITGQATLRVAVSPSSTNLNEYNIMTERTALIGVPIQLAQVLSDYSNSISTLTQAGGGIAGIATSLLSATVLSAINSQAPKVSTSGANGSFVECMLIGQLVSEFSQIVSGSNSILGRPLMDSRTINTLSGYIKCADVELSILNAFDSERDEIYTFMKGGFYYE